MKNPTLLQYFHWYYPDGGKLWPELAERAGGLNDIGINMVWLPPAYKGASGGYSVGYDSYDLFDLGEFDQKGSVATKYGDKAQLLAAIEALKQNDIAVLLDVVVNHKMGGRVTPSLPAPVNIRSLSGISNVSAVLITSKTRTKTASLRSSTTTLATAGTTRSMMRWVISTI